MKLDLSKYKLVYAKDDVIYGSETGIPADGDVKLIASINALAKYKLVYVNSDFTAILGSESGIPTDTDIVLYIADSVEGAEEEPEINDDNGTGMEDPEIDEDLFDD